MSFEETVQRVLRRTRALCVRFAAELGGPSARRNALIAGAVLVVTYCIPRGSDDRGLVSASELAEQFPRAWITTTFPPVAGLALLISAWLAGAPSSWLTVACFVTGFVPALVAAARSDLFGVLDLFGSLNEAASLLAVAFCVETLRGGDIPPGRLPRWLLVSSGIVLALGALAANQGAVVPTRVELLPATLIVTVERVGRLGAGWLAVQLLRRKPTPTMAAWLLVSATIVGALGFQPALVLGAFLSGNLTFWMAVNGGLLLAIKSIELVAGVAAVSYLAFGPTWRLEQGAPAAAPDVSLPAVHEGDGERAPTRGGRLHQYLVPLVLGGLLVVALAAKVALSHTPPDAEALPRGDVWWCDESLDICVRTLEACDPHGTGARYHVETCVRRDTVWCFTYVHTGDPGVEVVCKPQESWCEESRARRLRDAANTRVSDCARVGAIPSEAPGVGPRPPSRSPAAPEAPSLDVGQSGAARSPGQADSETLPVGDSPIIGPRAALVTIVEFGDFQCPYCARVEETLRQLRAHFGNDLRIVWKNNPLPAHGDAQLAAEAAMEAHVQGGNAGFWRFHDLIFEHREQLTHADLERYAQMLGLDMARFRASLDAHAHRDVIVRDQQLAAHLHATGTPTFFINGTQITGAQPYERFERLVDAVLTRARAIQPPTNAYATMVAAPLPSRAPPPTSPSAAPSPTPSAAPLRRLTPTSVSASSFISNRRSQHAPERAFDGDLSTAWNENERGPGDGTWIEATFSGEVTVRRVTLTTGYDSISQRHGDLFGLNSHLRRVRVSFDGGHAVERDVGEDQRTLVLDGLDVRTRTLRIEAISVWAGTRWADLCISEVTIEGDDARGSQGEPGAAQPHGAQLGRGDSPAARCTYATHTSFHLRAAPSVGRDGAEEIRSLPVVEVLGAGELRRGRDRIFNVRLTDGSGREGWMFIPTQELGADCPN